MRIKRADQCHQTPLYRQNDDHQSRSRLIVLLHKRSTGYHDPIFSVTSLLSWSTISISIREMVSVFPVCTVQTFALIAVSPTTLLVTVFFLKIISFVFPQLLSVETSLLSLAGRWFMFPWFVFLAIAPPWHQTSNELYCSSKTIVRLILGGKQFFQDYGPDYMSHPTASCVKANLNDKKIKIKSLPQLANTQR